MMQIPALALQQHEAFRRSVRRLVQSVAGQADGYTGLSTASPMPTATASRNSKPCQILTRGEFSQMLAIAGGRALYAGFGNAAL